MKGQQIWCNSKADGDSPDDREDNNGHSILCIGACLLWSSVPIVFNLIEIKTMNQSNFVASKPNKLNSTLLLAGKRIAYIQAGWHKDIVEQGLKSFTNHLASQGIGKDQIDLFNVPGSLEIPLQCKLLSKTGDYAVIIAAGLIVDGGIYRHDFVASSVLDSMLDIQLKSELPILSMVLTPHHFSGSQEHHDFFFDHFKIKGQEVADACVQTLENLRKLDLAA